MQHVVRGSVPTVAVLMTTHNRPKLLAKCLDSLSRQQVRAECTLFLTLDGNVEENEHVSRQHFPNVQTIHGDGTLYWSCGMAAAEARAVEMSPDYFLWLNEDVALDPDALAQLLLLAQRRPNAIVVGPTRDPLVGEITYGLRRRRGRNPQRFALIPPHEENPGVDTFNGNVALIPRAVRDEIGPIDSEFAHAGADDDYGLRARQFGIDLIQPRESIGTCSRETTSRTLRLRPLQRVRQMNHPLERPLSSQLRFLKRHGGALWPFWFVRNQIGYLLGSPFARRARKITK